MSVTFGQMLTTAREKRGLSLEDAAHETRIPAQRLRLLETDNIAGFGSLAYARAFIRDYSEFLGVDASDFLHDLPGGVLGGERDYRYLTHTQGPWLRERGAPVERMSAPAANGVRSVRSPVPAALALFMLVLAGTAIWGMHVAESQAKMEPAALKALPVEEEPAVGMNVPVPVTSQRKTASVKSKHVDFPVPPRKVQTID